MTDDATRTQNEAADPAQSTWLTANAGSGKTRVLTNRVARLLLNGVQPQNILCLTYTKAAASEMQNRLFKTLGTWAMLDEQDLREQLGALGEVPPNDLSRSRTLFASAIEAPGGLKIQTIHSFCSKILRQFPLEAGVNPQFREMDDASQREVLREVLEDVAENDPQVIQRVRRVYSGESLADLVRDVAKHAERFEVPRDAAEIRAAFGVPVDQTIESLVAQTISGEDIAFLKSLVPTLRALGKPTDYKLAEMLETLDDEPSIAVLETLEDKLLIKSGDRRFRVKLDVPTKCVKEHATFAPWLPEFRAIGKRLEAARRARLKLKAAEDAQALDAFAQAILPRYAEAKSRAGLLDFDDLIRKTKRLLTTRSLEWVLYRLDGRIDHVLVDEAQDTSPMQWDVVEALTSEMVDGESERARTLFVVGDKKQSIYSFQGADTEGFDRRAAAFGDMAAAGPGMERRELLHSFRSSPAILDTVDAVFSTNSGAGDATQHVAFHQEMPGRVDLWPLLPKPDPADHPAWHDLSVRTVENDAASELANTIANTIDELLKSGTIQGNDGEWRRVGAGDIMVLVQRRSALFDRIIAACKGRKLDIAGADRLKIGSELAVRDVLALLSFLALPEDDLSLAAALRSPLFGWTEQQLFDLAARRKEKTFLWQELRDRAEDFGDTYARLTELRSRVDFLRPFELIDEILTRHGGRERLLQRLGPEAEDGLDELLNQALAYERTHVPSLTGFVARARTSDIEVKRETETGGGMIRVMTVHGAKGLESPIVILPDTTFTRPRTGQDILEGPGGVPVLPRGKDLSPDVMLDVKSAKKSADEAERDRLLYVAMTRAEKWLIVCGIAPSTGASKEVLNWHEKVQEGLASLGAEETEMPTGKGGLRYQTGVWADDLDSPGSETEMPTEVEDFPEFGPLPVADIARPFSPSDLGGDKVLPGEPGDGSGGARKGRQMHILFEHLPGRPDPRELARTLLSCGPDSATEEEADALCAEALDIMERHPEIFGTASLAEVDIVADVGALGGRISGAIDRLLVTETRVVAVDFKTNAVQPSSPEEVPNGILRQMGAYLVALEAIYPGREIEVAVLWTASGTLMPLPHGIVRQALSLPQHLDAAPADT